MKKFATLLLTLPFSALAAAPTYTLLAPLGPLSGAVDLSTYLNGIMLVTIGVAGVLAVVMIVICGIQMIGSPSVSQKSASKECITNAILGLLLAAGSWIILNTINADLLKSDMNLGALPTPPAVVLPPASADPLPTDPGWYFRMIKGGVEINSQKFANPEMCLNVMKVAKNPPNPVTIANTPAGSGVECFQVLPVPAGSPPPPPGSLPPPPASEAAARVAICGNNSCHGTIPVGINNGPCVGGQTKGCTNVAGLPMSAINVVKNLASASGQNVVITGGTEGGHATHKPSAPIFDLRRSAAIDKYIQQNSTQSAVSFWPCRYLLNGFWWTNEGDHWHVCEVGQPYWFCKGTDKYGKVLPAGKISSCPK